MQLTKLLINVICLQQTNIKSKTVEIWNQNSSTKSKNKNILTSKQHFLDHFFALKASKQKRFQRACRGSPSRVDRTWELSDTKTSYDYNLMV